MKIVSHYALALLLTLLQGAAIAETTKAKEVLANAIPQLFKDAVVLKKGLVIEDSRGCLWTVEENERGILESVTLVKGQGTLICRQFEQRR